MTGAVRPLRAPHAGRREALTVGLVTSLVSVALGIAVVREGRLSLLLVGILVGGASVAALVRLRWTALLLWPVASVLAYPFIRFPSGHPILTFDRIWIPALAVTVAARRFPWLRSTQRFAVLLGVFAVVMGLRAASTHPDGLSALGVTIDAVVLPAIVFFAARGYARTPVAARALAGSLMFAGIALALLGIGESVFGFNLASKVHGTLRFDAALDLVRISGPYGVPEPFALSLLICLAATLYWLQSGGPTVLIPGLGIVAVELVSIGLTYFRAAWVAAILVIVASVGIRPGRRARLMVILAAVAVVAMFSLPLLEQSSGTFATRVNGQVAAGNVSGRFATYRQGLEIFRSSPVFGVGVNGYYDAATKRTPDVVAGVSSLPNPHSSFFSVLAEQGLVGFVPLVALTIAGWLMIRALRRPPHSRDDGVLLGAATGAAAAYLIMSLTLTMLPYGPSNAFFAAMLGIVAARVEARRSDVQGSEQDD